MAELLRKLFKRRNSVDVIKGKEVKEVSEIVEQGRQVREDFEKRGVLYSSKDDAYRVRPDWKKHVVPSLPPHQFTVTQIEHTQRYMAVDQIKSTHAELLSTAEWLKTNSAEALKLTMPDLMNKAVISGPKQDIESGNVKQHLQFRAAEINDFEIRLQTAIESYAKRIRWLLTGSRRSFGVVRGANVAVCVDASEANLTLGRLHSMQEALLKLTDEQLSKKHKIYMMSFGTDISSAWTSPRNVTDRIIEETKQFIMELRPLGGCNMMRALRHLYRLPYIDYIVFVVGAVPDQPVELVSYYVQQVTAGRDFPFHVVLWDFPPGESENGKTPKNESKFFGEYTFTLPDHRKQPKKPPPPIEWKSLRSIAEETGGRFHCYSQKSEETIYSSTDIRLLSSQIQQAQQTAMQVKNLRCGLVGNALVSIMDDISKELAVMPQSYFLPRPPGHEQPLAITMPKFHPQTSENWIRSNGLEARKLDLYQILAPNAYDYRQSFVPVTQSRVRSQVHERCMVQFGWSDGTIKNVHVDMPALFEYQKQLGETVRLLEARVDWLTRRSRRLWGTVTEKRVVFIIDLSGANLNYLIHIQHSMRLVLEQQMANKDFFNIIGFGGQIRAFNRCMVRVNDENLQRAWRFVLSLGCSGSRNFLGAFRSATEQLEQEEHDIRPEGVYLLTSGVPDEPANVITTYLEQAAAGTGVRVHTLLFTVDELLAHGSLPGRYASAVQTADCLREMAHCTPGGRFHWFSEAGIIESDDIKAVSLEIDQAINFSQKCCNLVETVKRKYPDSVSEAKRQEKFAAVEAAKAPQNALEGPDQVNRALTSTAWIEPKPTALTVARQQLREKAAAEAPKEWRLAMRSESVSDAKKVMAKSLSGKEGGNEVEKQKVATRPNSTIFYNERKNTVGVPVRNLPGGKTVRKYIPHPVFANEEPYVTTREWLSLHSLKRLGLDLYKLVSGPDCSHVEKPVKTLGKNVAAKYCCKIFPSVNINGTVKHLQLLPNELEDYEAQVSKTLERYLKRLRWLLSGSRRLFGVVAHDRVTILLDTSGSMEPYMDEVKREMSVLIWEQLHANKCLFNLIAFNETLSTWREKVVPATEENCHDAMSWVSRLQADGATRILDSVKLALEDRDIDAIYLLTDGKPDASAASVLREVARISAERDREDASTGNLRCGHRVSVNTISFNCTDAAANEFLRLLARETCGRFHRCQSDTDAHLAIHSMLSDGFETTENLSLPEFDGHDLRKLASEVARARRYLKQSVIFRQMYVDFAANNAKVIKVKSGSCSEPPPQMNQMLNSSRSSISSSAAAFVVARPTVASTSNSRLNVQSTITTAS